MDYQLVVVRGRSASKTLRLADGITTVGRQQDCQLRIGSSQVSRRHCQLYEKQGQLVVIDLGSSNGTFVNGKKIEGQQVLASGDVLSFGTVKFRIEKKGEGRPFKSGDTAIAEAVLTGEEGIDDEEFEIDFDQELEQEEATSKTADKSETHMKSETKPPELTPESANDIVADFLMNMELDEEDKR